MASRAASVANTGAVTGAITASSCDVPMETVRRDASYRRISLTIRHLLPGRKQVASHAT